jgi:sulfatase modifying factor 1
MQRATMKMMTSAPKCGCTPTRAPSTAPLRLVKSTRPAPATARPIPGGRGTIGTARPEIPLDGEGPERPTRLKPFLLSETAITNAEFAEFALDTGHVTDAERLGTSFVFWGTLPDSTPETHAIYDAEWWRQVEGANWRAINGPGTESTAWHPGHPVVHVSWNDATAYAAWAGGRLPNEAEWEHAARGGLAKARYPWGDAEPDDTTFQPCNIWQGTFPIRNTCADGYAATAPARSFAPNGYGLYNMCGNTWEWIADRFTVASMKKEVQARALKDFRVLKGGSYLCHRSYCYRYRIAARSSNTPDTSTSHQGFRVAWDV